MPRFEDMLPHNTEAEWSCGHIAGAVCSECYRELAHKAHEMQEQIDKLLEKIEDLEGRRL